MKHEKEMSLRTEGEIISPNKELMNKESLFARVFYSLKLPLALRRKLLVPRQSLRLFLAIAITTLIFVSKSWAVSTYVYDEYGRLIRAPYSSGDLFFIYNPDGTVKSEGQCTSFSADGSCSHYYDKKEYTYDANGNQTSERNCYSDQIDSSGNCTSYYDGHDNTYDANGNKTSSRYCGSVDSSGKCTSYSYGYDYTYDANGNKTSQRNCSSIDSSGKCSNYSSGSDYTYDANGNQTSYRYCGSVNSDGSCNGYSSGYDHTYDANGNKTSQRNCSSIDSSGKCSNYSSGSDYTYDANGNQTSERSCSSVDSSGKCTSYSYGEDYTYDYDDWGNIINRYANGQLIDSYKFPAEYYNRKCKEEGDGKYLKGRSCVEDCGKGYVGNPASGNCAIIIDDETTELNLENIDSDNLEIVCYGDMERCRKIAGKAAVSDRTYYNTPHMMDFSDKVMPATEDLCVGKYLWGDDSCNKMNEWECNASGEYYFDGTTCADRLDNGEIICNNPSYKLDNGRCWRVRYTPAEAAKVVGESNTVILYYK